MARQPKVWVSLSGGLDSTALLSALMYRRGGHEPQVCAISFSYGQRHARELVAAKDIAGYFGVPHQIVYLPTLSSPALTQGQPVPHGHYAEDTMVDTVVQGRNLLMASTAVALAGKGDSVVFAVHSGDHAIYPDCREEFWAPLRAAVRRAYEVDLVTPYIGLSKAEIVAVGIAAEAPFGLSWSCYEGGDVHCGRCGTCVERAEAFHVAGIPDPTVYADTTFWRKATEGRA